MRPSALVPWLLLLSLLAGCADGEDEDTDRTITVEPTAPATTRPPTTQPTTPPTTTTATASPAPTGTFPLFEDFEDGTLAPWRADAQVPDDPNRPGGAVAWNVTVVNGTGHEDHVHVVGHPVHAARFCIDGRQDDGTVWIERAFRLDAARAHRVNASFWAWGVESFNTIGHAVLYVGPDDPEAEADFPPPGTNGTHARGGGLRESLDRAEGWERYATAFDLPAGHATVWVAVGVSVVWETEVCWPLDALRVEVQPR